jgi:hypothetical protein
MAAATRARVRIPLLFLIWIIIGLIVAINRNYANNLDNADAIATFILAVVLWPIPFLDGAVRIYF